MTTVHPGHTAVLRGSGPQGWAGIAITSRRGYCWRMTSTPIEPESDPQTVPAGDPGMDPVDPDQQPDAPIPEAEPAGG
jgi:hypothetical protein